MTAPTPDNDHIVREERAAHFLAVRLGNPSAADDADFLTWLKADPRNALAYARLDAAWDMAAALRLIVPSPERDGNARALTADAQAQQQQ